MRIQDMELLSGMDRATVRFYEKEGLIDPDREENGYRSYSEEDLQLLLKIKLLRRLGVSLQKIKALQQGSEDFRTVLQQQIEILENKIKEDTAAKDVCVEMQQNRVDFHTLNSQKYLKMLDNPNASKLEFKEEIIRECHPWRRYFARILDLGLIAALVEFFVVVMLGVRPYGEGLQLFLKYGSYFAAIPIWALLVSKWGTTPGKWVMGIRLDSYEGGNLDFRSAFDREKQLIWYGFGLFIPFYEIWRLYRSYKKDTEGEKNEWNCDTELIYSDWTTIKKAGTAIIVVLTVLLNIATVLNAVMPPDRYKEMTVAQFAENFNTYYEIFDYDTYLILDSNGKWIEPQTDGVRISVGEDVDYIRPEFQFVLDGQKVKAVQYTESWQNQSTVSNVLPTHCRMAMYTLVGSQPDAGYQEMREVDQLIEELLLSTQKGGSSGEKKIGDVVFSWDLKLSNWDYAQNGMLYDSVDNLNGVYELYIAMEIHPD